MVIKRYTKLGATATLSLTITTLLPLAACSTGKQYAAPEQVCGVPVEGEIMKALLSDGKSVTQSEDDHGPRGRQYSCQVVVDNRVDVAVDGEWHETRKSPLQVARASLYHQAEQKESDRFAVWPGGVVAVRKCHNPARAAAYFSLITTVRKDDQDDFASTADKFARDLTKKLMAKQPCEEG